MKWDDMGRASEVHVTIHTTEFKHMSGSLLLLQMSFLGIQKLDLSAVNRSDN